MGRIPMHISISKELEKGREKMIISSKNQSLSSDEVVHYSQQLDKLINLYQMKGESLLEIHSKQLNDNYYLTFKGQLDIVTEEKINMLINHLINKEIGKYKKIFIDLSELSFIDSTGIGALLKFILKTNENGIEVNIAAMNTVVAELLELVGVYSIMKELNVNPKFMNTSKQPILEKENIIFDT
jgi:anti-anti-sigma factor